MRIPKRPRRLILWTTLAPCVLSASVRLAHGADPDLTQLDLATLMKMDVTVVTAQKRREDVTTVPVSMTVLKRTTLQGLHLDTSADLQSAAPGLTTSSNDGLMLPYVRGIGSDIIATGSQPSVAVYVDGVYQAERVQTFVDLADVEQVELLKGPQGTLYGRNATGGAINITTRAPTNELRSDAHVGVGNLDQRDGSLFIAGPLNERVRASFSGHTRERDGYYRNIVDGRDVNSQQFYSLHGRMQFDVREDFRAELLLKRFKRDDSYGYGTDISDNSRAAQLGARIATEPFETASDMDDGGQRWTTNTAALKLNWTGLPGELQSTTSYNEQRHGFGIDFDASARTLSHLQTHEVSRTFAQEVLLSSEASADALDWLIGVFYIDTTDDYSPMTMESSLRTPVPRQVLVTGDVHTKALASFGEATLAFNQAFSLTAGLRYSQEKKSLVDASIGIAGTVSTGFEDRRDEWDDVSYRLVAKYTLDRSMLYAKTETGFKSGAFNNTNPVNPGPIDPEQVTAYEIGFKTSLATLPMQLSTAAFFNDYTDLQNQAVDATTGSTVLVQAPHARTYGLDLNADLKASRHWSVGGGLSWLRAEYREYIAHGVQIPSPAGGHVPATRIDLSGNHLSRAPALTANLMVAFDYPVPLGAVFGTANYYHSSRLYFDAANTYAQNAFDIVNAQLGLRFGTRWSVSAWANNLTDTTYLTCVIPGPLGAFAQYAEPRTFGLNVDYSFGR
ncbi:MAG: TonB-dependent receptor [Steroidobacteraceae bacterium]